MAAWRQHTLVRGLPPPVGQLSPPCRLVMAFSPLPLSHLAARVIASAAPLSSPAPCS